MPRTAHAVVTINARIVGTMVVFGPHEHEEGAGAGGAVVPRGVSNNEEASSTVSSCVGVGGVWYFMIRRNDGAWCVFFIFAIYWNYDMYNTVH